MRTHPRVYQGIHIKVLCGCCLGTGLIGASHFSRAEYDRLREEAQARGIREGWYEVVWEGEPGHARQVPRRMGPAEFVERSA